MSNPFISLIDPHRKYPAKTLRDALRRRWYHTWDRIGSAFAELARPDWYWNADDPDQASSNWEEMAEIENLGYGDTCEITVTRLLELQPHTYRVTRPTEEEEDRGDELKIERIK